MLTTVTVVPRINYVPKRIRVKLMVINTVTITVGTIMGVIMVT